MKSCNFHVDPCLLSVGIEDGLIIRFITVLHSNSIVCWLNHRFCWFDHNFQLYCWFSIQLHIVIELLGFPIYSNPHHGIGLEIIRKGYDWSTRVV